MKIKNKEFERIIDELKEILSLKGITLRFEKGEFKGGFCLLKANRVIVINRISDPPRKLTVIGAALEQMGVTGLEIPAKFRHLLWPPDEIVNEELMLDLYSSEKVQQGDANVR